MRKNVCLCSVGIAALAMAAPAMAQDVQADGEDGYYPDETGPLILHTPKREILIVASRGNAVGVDAFTGSQIRFDKEELEERQVRDVAEILRDAPGLAVSEVAGQTQVRLRGSEANHVLVLIDGIEVSDPFAGEFDLGTLQVEPGSRIEVLRGPQSALHGADAIGGVIAYHSARGDEIEGLAARIEAGTQGTVNGSARFGIGDYGANLALGGTIVSTDGAPNARGGVRDIGRDSYTLSGKSELQASDGLRLRAAGRFIRTEGEFNDQDFDPTSPTFGFVIDSPGTRFENEAIYGLVGATLATFDEVWTHDLSAQFADIRRDSFGPFGRSSGSEGDRLKASYVSAVYLTEGSRTQHITFGAEWERERFRNDDPFGFAFSERREIENVGLIGEYRFEGRNFDLSAAIRHDINDRFADATTFRFGAGYDLGNSTRLRASIGSGIKNPGFFELFGFFDGRFIGNEDLKPEKSTGWEIGIDQDFGTNMRVSATYFDSTLENEIFTTFPSPNFIATPANRTSDSTQRGVEIELAAQLGAGFSLDAAYTYLDAKEDGVEEVRRPDHVASAALNWTAPSDTVSASLVLRHNGEAEDLAFTDPSFIPVRVTLDDYTLVDLNARVKLSDGIEAFGRVENILDETYEQVFSFVSPSRSAVIGISASF